jgi:HPr kinase/phosphorylase
VNNSKNQHGVLLSIFGKGVLLQGPSGVGKSECALCLIDRGHQLIADDTPLFSKSDSHLIGSCPANIAHLLEIRGLGIVDIQQLFGDKAVLKQTILDLIIQITPSENVNQARIVAPELDSKVILGISIPNLTLPLIFSKNMAILIETAVRLVFSSSSPRVERLLKCD